jgi:phospholipid/cholesterol/gamma-HCH transport system permease protein
MDSPYFKVTPTSQGETVYSFLQPLDFQHAQALWESILQSLRRSPPSKLILDFESISIMDSSGLALIRLLKRYCDTHGIPLEHRSIPSSAEYFARFLDLPLTPSAPSEDSFLTARVSSLGGIVRSKWSEWNDLVRFIGDFFISTGSALHHFRRFRWREVLYYAQLSGADAMPIVFLLSFLLGLVMAFQGAVQLRQFGANIFVADLLSLAMTRELGPVFTAVILAGRSGSAFAAEIGTMKVNEEVDALVVMGFDITKFLVLPKVIALALCGPLLTMLANASSIVGGIVVGIVSLDLTAASFVQEVYSILTLTDVFGGLAKSLVFSILVALIGCFRGLQADKGADSVGRQTTSAVVSGIFLIILADAVFTVLYHIFDI